MAANPNQVGGQFQSTGGVSLSVSGASARVALSGDGVNARVANPNSFAVYVAFGDSSVTATTASTCILPGTAEVLNRLTTAQPASNYTYIAGITGGSSGTIQISTGNGF